MINKLIYVLLATLALTACDKVPTAMPLTAPANLRVTYVSATGLTYAWDEVSGAKGYSYKIQTESGATLMSSSTTALEAVFTGLTVDRNYRVAVMALSENEKLNSPFSEFVVGRTVDNGNPPPDPPIEETDFDFPSWENDALVRAFPGAEGGGMFTAGGRGGAVYHVTKLTDDTSSGTLRWAIQRSGARTIVFDVSGIIALNSTLEIKNGDLTIAGQTAPGDGICIKNYSVVVKANNVIIRFLRFRMGDEKQTEDDAIWGRNQKDIIIDHCSMSWSTDECSSFYANQNFTMQWCMLGESLRVSVHGKGTHGYGAIWGGVSASYHHNLLAHHDSRNPRFDGADVYKPYKSDAPYNSSDRAVDYRNCVVYNFSNQPAYGGESQTVNFVNNYYKWGPASLNGPDASTSGKRRLYFYYIEDVKEGTQYGLPSIYAGGNCLETIGDNQAHIDAAANISTNTWAGFVYGPNHSGEYTKRTSIVPIMKGTEPCRVTNHISQIAFERVLDYAGASLHRDAVDARYVNDVTTGTASCMAGAKGSRNGLIDTQTDVGGYPVYNSTAALVDSDGDGIPDEWEDAHGLNKHSVADGNAKTLDPTHRYTNLEVYLHWLVKDIVLSQSEGGTYITLN